MAVSGPVTLKEIKPDVGELMVSSIGRYNFKYPEPLVLPNYLRASIGSCHDICKFGRKRDFIMETGTTTPRKFPMSPNESREVNRSNNLKKKNNLLCSPRSPSTVRKPASQVKGKAIQSGAKEVAANVQSPRKLKMKHLEKKGAPNGGWNSGTNASKQTQIPRGSKKSILVPKTSSLSPKPEVKNVRKKASCSKNKDTKAEIEPASVEDIPEKILFITELNSENQAVGFNLEENIDATLQFQKQIDASLLQKNEDESYIDKEIDSVQLSPRSSTSKDSNGSQSHEWDNSTGLSSFSPTAEADIGSPNMRTEDVYCKPDGNETEYEMNNVYLRHQNIEQKRSAEGLLNDVIEVTARELVKTRKGKVKALVHAFEAVISLQDLSRQQQLNGDELPKFPLCVD